MIKLNITLDSHVLLRPVDVTVYMPYSIMAPRKPYTSLWALHPALSGSHFFFDYLGAASYVDKEQCAIIAPNLGNGYYINASLEQQADFLQDELFPYLQHTLSLSKNKDDSVLLGISAGAFGAAHWMHSTPQNFSKVALISGCYSYFHEANAQLKHCREQYALYKLVQKKIFLQLGNVDALPTNNDMTPLLPLSGEAKNWPHIALFCGEDDYLSEPSTQIFYDACNNAGLDIALNISSGGHDLAYWAKVFPHAIAWLVQK